MTTREILAQRQIARTQAMHDALQELEDKTAYAIDVGIDACVYTGMFTAAWASSAKRNALCRKIAQEVVRRVVAETDRDIPDEVAWLWGTERKPVTDATP